MWSDRRPLMIGLASSLLVNVFFLGIIVGHGFVLHKETRPPPPGLPAIAAPRLVQSLPVDQKEIFEAAMAAHYPAIRAARRDRREIRLRAEADIMAPIFDHSKAEAALDALHQANRALENAYGAALLDALAGMSPAARATLVGRTPEAAAKRTP